MQQLPKLDKATLSKLLLGKNLLAFSGGVDSSALFFTLLANKIPFEVAHVNYQTRVESDIETAHVKALCEKHSIPCHTFKCKIENGNFEHKARNVRYDFFAKILKERDLTSLLTAHQLNDRLEWLLMRLIQGAGVSSLAGFSVCEKWNSWERIRPFGKISKADLQDFLNINNLPYFHDSSNKESKHLRNYIRHSFSDPLLKMSEKGISKSLDYLKKDADTLEGLEPKNIKDLWVIDRHNTPSPMIAIDKIIKRYGIVMSSGERENIFEKDGVISGKIAIGWHLDFIGVAPYVKTFMPKEFKEACRVAKIPPILRPYMYVKGITPNSLADTLLY